MRRQLTPEQRRMMYARQRAYQIRNRDRINAYRRGRDAARTQIPPPDPVLHNEQWLSALGFEGWYEVSDQGRVRRMRKANRTYSGRILKPTINPDGYSMVELWTGRGTSTRIAVHRLVAMAFIGPPEARHEVNHIDGNPSNNVRENLEWVTHAENMQHAHRIGLFRKTK